MGARALMLLIVIRGISSYDEFEKLDPLDDDNVDVVPRVAARMSELITSGSGAVSGSGDLLVPISTESTPTPEYGTSSFIRLTFTNLSSQQYQDNSLEEQLRNLIFRLLNLDSFPLVIFEDTTVLVYFPVESSSTTSLEFYAKTLGSINDTEWTDLSTSYGLTAVEVETLTFPMPWWHWLITGLIIFGAASAYLLILMACCCRYNGLKKKNPRVDYKERRGQQVFPLEEGNMQEQARQQLVRKVSRVNFQSRSNMHFYSHPLSVVDLERLVVNPSSLLSEYTTVPSNMVTMAEVSAGAEGKNRYKDVLPNPQTRVALFLKFGVANSDYINANYIRGYKNSSKFYIATQGPLHWTVADFWRMVWEQKCSTIVMTTKLEEKGMVKCIQYWPDEKQSHSIVYEDLEVHLRRRVITKNYSTTTFLLQHKDKMVSREVTHFWFTGWPDHGAPSAPAVLEFLLHIRKHTSLDIPGPIVVHCSAGIGRSGVFIAADIAMQQLDQEEEVDILQILSSLRQDRGGMIQTKEQYVFLHKVLLEYANSYGRKVRLEPTIEEDEPMEDVHASTVPLIL